MTSPTTTRPPQHDGCAPATVKSVTVEWFRSGQQGRYEDAVYEARVRLSRSTGLAGRWLLPIEKVERIVKVLVHDYAGPRDAEHFGRYPYGMEPYLARLEQESPGVWLVRVVKPWSD